MTQATPVLPYLPPASDDAATERRVLLKVTWRLIPLMCFLYLFNYLDRVNVSYAKLAMPNQLPWFTEAAYATGAAIFFVGYFLFEVPSNLIMERVGARVWMARIMVSWGVISTAMAFVTEPWHFYWLRLLLGVAEAGFFPGMLLYITYWVPSRQRSMATALFMTSTALSGVVGGLLADQLMKVHGWGLVGWQWMFVLEGLPSVVLGFGILFMLPNRPGEAKWLTVDEKRVLADRLAADHDAMPHDAGHHLLDAARDPRVWLLCLLYGTLIMGFYVINYWTPTLVKNSLPAGSTTPVGLLSAIPFFAATVTMSVVGIWTDRTGKRRRTMIWFALLGAAGYALAALSPKSTPLMVLALSMAAAGIWSTLGPFWAMPSRFLRGTAVAAGLGLINSVGNLLGGYIGNEMMGRIKTAYDSYTPGLWVSCGVALAAAGLSASLVLLRVRDDVRTDEG